MPPPVDFRVGPEHCWGHPELQFSSGMELTGFRTALKLPTGPLGPPLSESLRNGDGILKIAHVLFYFYLLFLFFVMSACKRWLKDVANIWPFI